MIIQCFGAGGALLSATDGTMVRASGMSLTYVAGPRWWQGNADSNDAGLTRLQTIRLAPEVQSAIIGVARIDADYEVRSLRLACDPSQSPPVLYGTPELPHGVRELKAETAWDPPSIAAGASAQLNVPCPGVRPGGLRAGGLQPFHLRRGVPRPGGRAGRDHRHGLEPQHHRLDLAAGTLRVRAVKS